MSQRRIDLMCMETDELVELQRRLQMLRRAARELGAVKEVMSSWDLSLEDVEAELQMRADDDALPF